MSTRTAILDAAQVLIQTRGANGMSYDSISSVVGIRKASIHYHFATKADLLAAVVERYAERFLGAVDIVIANNTDGLAKLQNIVALFEQTLRQEGGRAICACGMLASELGTLDETTEALIRTFFADCIERLAVVLVAGRDDGSLAFDCQPQDLASLIFSLLQGALMTARVAGGIQRFRAIASNLYTLVGAS
ncbi:MAG: TetR/AcrR family transcriptional regulator [Myxococcota bacterium]